MIVLVKRKYKQTHMAHLPALVSSEKLKICNAYVNKLVSELVIGCYFYLRSYLYDEFV